MPNLTEQGVKDSLHSVEQIRRVLRDRREDAEQRLATAEADVTELRKLESFASMQGEELTRQLVGMTGEAATDKPAL